MKDALYRPGKLSLDGQANGEDLRSVDDEYCYLHSAYLQAVAKSSVLAMIEALSVTRTQADFADFSVSRKTSLVTRRIA